MGVTLDYDLARKRLVQAVERAKSNRPVPDEWVKRTKIIRQSPSKTFTVALGTALLARATDLRVDALALKSSSSDSAYSARSLAHNVLVEASTEHNFDLRATGREPLNNQPFFRYDRIDEMDRVHPRSRPWYNHLVEFLRYANKLDGDEAFSALSAFLRVCTRASREVEHVYMGSTTLGVNALIKATTIFIHEDTEGGARAQALVASVFDLVYEQVRTGRINDPSRRFPGDVQAFHAGYPILAAEVRAKPVSPTDVLQFCRTVSDAGIAHGMMAALDQHQDTLPTLNLRQQAEEQFGITVTLIQSVEELLLDAFTWGHRSLNALLEEFPTRMARRLYEIEANPQSLQRWTLLCRT